MTKLYRTGNNTTEIENDKARILYSYNTAVAAYVYGRGYIKSATHYSSTTSQYVYGWIGVSE